MCEQAVEQVISAAGIRGRRWRSAPMTAVRRGGFPPARSPAGALHGDERLRPGAVPAGGDAEPQARRGRHGSVDQGEPGVLSGQWSNPWPSRSMRRSRASSWTPTRFRRWSARHDARADPGTGARRADGRATGRRLLTLGPMVHRQLHETGERLPFPLPGDLGGRRTRAWTRGAPVRRPARTVDGRRDPRCRSPTPRRSPQWSMASATIASPEGPMRHVPAQDAGDAGRGHPDG